MRKHATVLQETLLAVRPLELAGDSEDTGLRAASRSEEIAKRCRMHEVGGRGVRQCVFGGGRLLLDLWQHSFIDVRPGLERVMRWDLAATRRVDVPTL